MEQYTAIISIIVMDLVLSGDNAVVIGMAAHSLPGRQRKMAIVFGGGAAVLLRMVNTSIVTLLLGVPALKAIGGVLLLWIAFKLLKQEEASHGHVKAGGGFRDAMITIMLADFIMSLDNVLAVAAAAHGSIELLIFGLALSIPIVLFFGSITASLIDRFWWLAYVGSGVIAWTGAEMAIEDEFVRGIVHGGDLLRWTVPAVATIAVLAFSHWFHSRGKRIGARKVAAMAGEKSTETPVA